VQQMCSKDLKEMAVICLNVACIGMDVGSDVSTGEQNFCCWRTFLSVKPP
jgi:hypothetical protein